MYPRILQPPASSFFLFGPRGTGKTTWVHEHFAPIEGVKIIDLLEEGRYQDYLRDVTLFSQEVETLASGNWVVVDEIQRLPGLLNEVHRFIEKKKLRFALTGSSARKVRRAGVNLLGGRALRMAMFPFVPQELQHDFDIERTLRWGSLPIIWQSDVPDDALRAYVQLYLKEEIQAEALTRNLPGFARFLPVSALFHGQILNISTLARDAGVARTTVAGYLEILEDTLLATRLRAYEGRLRVREKRHPKLYWIDSGLVRALKNLQGTVAPEEKGALFEGYLFMVLRAYGELHNRYQNIYYWSPADSKKLEVDFLIIEGDEIIAIEAKATTRLREDHFRGLRAVKDLDKLRRRLIVYLGKSELKTEDGIEVWPFETFSERLTGNLL